MQHHILPRRSSITISSPPPPPPPEKSALENLLSPNPQATCVIFIRPTIAYLAAFAIFHGARNFRERPTGNDSRPHLHVRARVIHLHNSGL